MKFTAILWGVLPALTSAARSSSTGPVPGYSTSTPSTLSANASSALSFGQHYAVLNLDLINGIIGYISGSPAGQLFINNTARWIDAVHAQTPPPLSIFTRIYFSNHQRPEIGVPFSPFSQTVAGFGNVTEADSLGMLYPAFTPLDDWDVVMPKTRYYAGAGNALEEILRAQQIDTVILSGVRTSGVILSTAYRLFDLDYKVYVIANNTIETPPMGPEVNDAILQGIIPKLPANVITIEEALAALSRSGPAVY